jgi:nitrogen fixation protein NifB
MSQMTHCARCRADAIGRLGEGMDEEMHELIQSCARLPIKPREQRPHVAVATREGMLVNQHLGEARAFAVFGPDPDGADGFACIETREAPPTGGREDRWKTLARILRDCRAVLVSAAGSSPRQALTDEGIKVIEMEGMIDAGLEHVFNGEDLPPSLKRSFQGCGMGVTCGGDGTGCG